jgi:hypothetical protein
MRHTLRRDPACFFNNVSKKGLPPVEAPAIATWNLLPLRKIPGVDPVEFEGGDEVSDD